MGDRCDCGDSWCGYDPPAPQPSSEGREADELCRCPHDHAKLVTVSRYDAERAAREAAEQQADTFREALARTDGYLAECGRRRAAAEARAAEQVHRATEAEQVARRAAAEATEARQVLAAAEQRVAILEEQSEVQGQRAEDAEAKLRTAVEALLFYAAYESWTDETIEFGSASAAVDSDDGGGNRARAALAAIRGETE